jgi:hypothetical protein
MTKSQQKAQEGHLEEGEAARPTKGMKSGKTTKRARKTQNQHPPESTPPNTLNASSPP